MKIYKYKDFSNPDEDAFRHLEDCLRRRLIWCARHDTLNDPREFIWECDYTATLATPDLLTDVLVKAPGRTKAEARAMAGRR